MRISVNQVRWLKGLVHLLSLLTFIYFAHLTFSGGFGADPVKGMEHFTGKTALNMLILTMLISPVAKKFRQGNLMRMRRMLGLYTFFWVTLHLVIYMGLDLGFSNYRLLGSEIASRPYLTIGIVSWLILLLLSVTSLQKVQRKMGKAWQKLHNWVYLVLILAPLHYYWSVKSGIIEPSIYFAIAIILILLRRDFFIRKFNELKLRYVKRQT